MKVYAIRTVNDDHYCKNARGDSTDFRLTRKHPKLFTSKSAVKRWIEQRANAFEKYVLFIEKGRRVDEVFEVIEFSHEEEFIVHRFNSVMQRFTFVDVRGVGLKCGQNVAIAHNDRLIVGTVKSFGENLINYTSNGVVDSVPATCDRVVVL